MSATLIPPPLSAVPATAAVQAPRPARPSELHVLWLLTGIGLRFWRHRLGQGLAAFRKPSDDAPAAARPATPGKRNGGFWLPALLGLSFLWLGFIQGTSYLGRMADRLNPVAEVAAAADAGEGEAAQDRKVNRVFGGTLWTGGAADCPVILALGLYLATLTLTHLAYLLCTGQQDLGKVAWDVEWLFTFPVPARTLFLSRLLQNATAGQLGLWLLLPPCLLVAYACAGFGWWTLPLALAVTGCVALGNASLALVVEVWAQKKLAPSRRKNMQAVLALAAGGLSFLAMAVGLSETLDGVIAAVVGVLPPALAAVPFALPAVVCAAGWESYAGLAGLGFLGIALPLGSVRLAQALVSDGLVACPGTYQGERSRPAAAAPSRASWLDGVLGKELRLLARDRAFLAQTLLMPVILLGFIAVLYWEAGSAMLQAPRQAAMLAFGVGAYVLVFSAFQVLNAEGNTLWLLYSVPQDLRTILARKTCLWGAVAALYVVAVLAVAALLGMPLGGEAAWAGCLAVGGVVLYAFIAAALGTLATNPQTADSQRRVRVDMSYAYLLLAGLYLNVLQAESFWPQLSQVVLTALLAVALWQKVGDRLSFLLEPTEDAPPRVSAVDGLIAALGYLTLQGFLTGLLATTTELSIGERLLVATAVAGTVVTLAALYLLRKVPDLLRVTGLVGARGRGVTARLRLLVPGMAAGLLAGAFGVAYLAVVNHIEALRAWKESSVGPSQLGNLSVLAWVVLAAPVIEEFLFRGLLFQGLRRSATPRVAIVLSAAAFTVVHPAVSALPVFVLGVATALSFRRTGWLLTPIVAHVIYNAVVVAAELLFRAGV